ncbi:3-deoxy-manno-octulosonate cytidylyltransferase [Sphingomonas mucosissima]|uniref:3-deoxy-manno-octulosonate cytidylyltransferase n=1 Tax=Sphingomonas mucosissima TaxID=370959 RepID=A0A245ZT63_9SPHN|nr:3-deoxy-manno-octulosonate cytidylyltransferase [Sphingomonas mucosissima]OWK32942.1 3-deoxy-manno-octulosonate cytidylyltransferase [Sphingomonas mucosissima]
MPLLVVIPARAGSTRLPLKPLLPIAGVTLLHRTIAYARRALADMPKVQLIVATDHEAIAAHAREFGCDAVITDAAIATGSGRALAAARLSPTTPEIIINLQGDAPFQPISAPAAIIHALSTRDADVATPVVRLTWEALDALRDHKRNTPFSGTTCARAANGRALWFSKKIIPAIRNEGQLRSAVEPCPVWRHIGIYGYRRDALERFEAGPASELERLEGLEQLRLLELGLRIEAVEVSPAPFDISGIDTPADIVRAETLIAAHGDPHF